MIRISEFAALGRVSMRMLRHYDAIGLLQPSYTNQQTGYRYYSADQLHVLNRIVALRDLGLRLDEIAQIIDDHIDGDQLRAMLHSRRDALESELQEGAHRLARIEARLRLIDTEDGPCRTDVVRKQVPPVTGFGLRELVPASKQTDIGSMITDMHLRMSELISRDATGRTGKAARSTVAYYAPAVDHGEGAVWVQLTTPSLDASAPGAERIDIPAGRVASLLHKGSIAGVDETYQSLHRWIRENGFTATGTSREAFLERRGDDDWVTDVQIDIQAGREDAR